MKTFNHNITSLQPNEVFVFGSNPEGRHGAGAAKTARVKFGAKYSNPVGLQGQSYAIITKELRRNKPPITLDLISRQIKILYKFAKKNPQLTFYVTPLGTQLAGFTPEQIASCFEECDVNQENVIVHENIAKHIMPG